jgi:hypothetical protein
MRRLLQLLGLLFLVVQLSCAHGLSECKECGSGKVCRRTKMPGSSIPITECYTSCRSDRDCVQGQACNCEGDSCSHHSSIAPLNVCLAGGQRPTSEFDSRFQIEERDQRFCQGCAKGELCIDVGSVRAPDFRCIKQCARDTECPAPMICNCGTVDCSAHNALVVPNICLLPPPMEEGVR